MYDEWLNEWFGYWPAVGSKGWPSLEQWSLQCCLPSSVLVTGLSLRCPFLTKVYDTGTFVVPIVRMRKLRLSEANSQQHQKLNQVYLIPKFKVSNIHLYCLWSHITPFRSAVFSLPYICVCSLPLTATMITDHRGQHPGSWTAVRIFAKKGPCFILFIHPQAYPSRFIPKIIEIVDILFFSINRW